jgi:hypothetical protein
MNQVAGKYLRHGVSATVLVLLLAQYCAAGCWVNYPQSVIGSRAPIIVVGEIVAIDTATAQGKERDVLRYLDAAKIKVEKVYKNALKDVTVAEKGELTVFMHSTNQSVPGSEPKEGQRLRFEKSTDLSYKVGTRAVWFLFLQSDGKFYINRHPQQCLPLEKGAKAPAEVALGVVGLEFGRDEWAKQDKSNLRKE